MEKNEIRIWNSNQIFIGALFGSFLCGFYLLGQNYKALGHPQLAKKALVAVIASSAILFSTVMLLPDEVGARFGFFLMMIEGLLLGSYLTYEHFKSFYNQNYLTNLLIAIPCIIIAGLSIGYFLPENWIAFTTKPWLIGLSQALIAQGFFQSYQQNHVKELADSKKGSFLKLGGITLFMILAQVFFIFSIAFLLMLATE